MMTARFERVKPADMLLLAFLLACGTMFLFPGSTAASSSNKTSVVPEIKNLPVTTQKPIVLPTVSEINRFVTGLTTQEKESSPQGSSVQTENTIEQTSPQVTEVVPTEPLPAGKVEAKPMLAKSAVVVASAYLIPPKAVNKVYMQEPEIRAYVCPKLGSQCDTFIAILKAENGTHECTRDNRGTNRNGSIDIGLAQINWSPRSPYTFEQLQDCTFNLDIALKKYDARGFRPWVAYTSGSYKRHLVATAMAPVVADEQKPLVTLPTN
ncbi:MAG: hypothetical protein ACM3KM_00050 [Acidobacteriaceae bacterium]